MGQGCVKNGGGGPPPSSGNEKQEEMEGESPREPCFPLS